MPATIIIGALLLLYAVYVIRKKIKDVKAGKFCSCGCSSCSCACKQIPDRDEQTTVEHE